MPARTLSFAALALLAAAGASAATPPWPRNATPDQVQAARTAFERQMTASPRPERPQAGPEGL